MFEWRHWHVVWEEEVLLDGSVISLQSCSLAVDGVILLECVDYHLVKEHGKVIRMGDGLESQSFEKRRGGESHGSRCNKHVLWQSRADLGELIGREIE